jgi:outer membrane protein assembly factor BamB
VFGKAIGAWGGEYLGELKLDPLFQTEREQWLVAQDDVLVVDLKTGTESPRFKLPIDAASDWSIDAEGVLCVMGTHAGRKVVVAMSTAGEERWRWIDGDDSDRWSQGQPPIRGNSGRVFVLSDGRVLALDAGKLAWTYDARSESLRHGARVSDGSFEVKDGMLLSTARLRYGTALSDGSLLVVGNNTLRHIDAEGRLNFAVTVSGEILTPPVVDAEGSIYVATATKLFKIR